MKTGKLALTLAASLAAAAAPAQTVDYYWNETGSSYGDGSGLIAIDEFNEGADNSNISGQGYDFNVVSITGTINGDTLGYFYGGTVNFSTDTAPASSAESAFLGFTVNSSKYVLEQYPTYEAIIIPSPDGLENDDGQGTFTLAVPEPGTLTLGAVGGLSLLALRRRT